MKKNYCVAVLLGIALFGGGIIKPHYLLTKQGIIANGGLWFSYLWLSLLFVPIVVFRLARAYRLQPIILT